TLVFRPRLAWPYLPFGLNSVGASLTDFGAKNFSTLMVGSLLGVATAGHYAMAYQIVRVPELVVSGPLYLSMFVSVARWGDDVKGALPLALKGLRGGVALLAPLFCGLALVSDPLVKLLLGPAWTATGPILTLLAPAGFFLCCFSFLGATLLGLGRSDLQFRLILLSSTLLVAGTVIGSRFGATGVAGGMSAGAALAAPAYLYLLARQFHLPIATLLHEILSPIMATAAMAIVVFTIRRELPAGYDARNLAILVPSGVASFALALTIFSGARLREDFRWLLGSSRRTGNEKSDGRKADSPPILTHEPLS
ncbi:MAG: oligosaccharide flippase family protein, partial [Rhizomicrobium sp.]